jgi:hypothetical protein
MMARASIKQISECNVIVSFDDAFTGERQTLDLTIPNNGGYIRDEAGRQVCNGLSLRGYTLDSKPGAAFLKTVREEYRRMRRAEARIR